ncbi:MAG: hypothetical protein ACTSRZ_00720 [Promethearchaeota archaeon]
MKKSKIYILASILILLFGAEFGLIYFANATGDDVCAGSIIKYKGLYYQQDSIYPEGYSEEFPIWMTAQIFQLDGTINGSLNESGSITDNIELTNLKVPSDWMMKDPTNNELILPDELYFISTPEKAASLKQELQSMADNDDDWEFSYSGLEWILRGSGADDLGNPWTYEGIITYDYNTQLQSVVETITIQGQDSSAYKQYSWTLVEIVPGPTCASQDSDSGSQSNSAAIIFGTGAIYYMIGIFGVSLLIWYKHRMPK